MRKTLLFSLLLVIVFWVAVAHEQSKGAATQNKRESYAAVVVGTGGMIGGRTLNLNIHIDRHTSDQEVQEFLVLLKEKGQDALRKELEKITVGRLAPDRSTGTDLSIARVFETEDGKVIRLVAARPVSFLEAYRHGRSMDYPFTIMELRLNQEGKGEGSILAGAQVKFDENGQLDITSYGNQYAKLVNIRTWD